VLEAASSLTPSDHGQSVAEADGGEPDVGDQETIIDDGYENHSDPCHTMHVTSVDSIDVSICD